MSPIGSAFEILSPLLLSVSNRAVKEAAAKSSGHIPKTARQNIEHAFNKLSPFILLFEAFMYT